MTEAANGAKTRIRTLIGIDWFLQFAPQLSIKFENGTFCLNSFSPKVALKSSLLYSQIIKQRKRRQVPG
jgi:hypothetical protein